MTRIFQTQSHAAIDAPAEDVFAAITDPTRWPDWHPASILVDLPGPVAATGTTFLEVVALADTTARLRWRTDAASPPTMWMINARTEFGAVAATVTVSFRIVPLGSGAIEVKRSMVTALATETALPRALRAYFGSPEPHDAYLAAVKNHLESAAA
ncbi:SRPBCC family protein [Nocardia panacis]|uniref:SRPBCC family protein n=1 Tax=Nocardia panacis TaxID=2340916 RepID=A0A3A4KHP3_9NOCA|nr:SRPBCC family protein [Nocardia panacis]RJO74116.1 SRPBCC family protein [Nocardia panacis]